MNCVLTLGLLLMLAFVTHCRTYGGKQNGKCSKCQWFKPRCREKSSGNVIHNCYEGLFHSPDQIYEAMDDIDSCPISSVVGEVKVYGDKRCPDSPFEKKNGELRLLAPLTEEEARSLNDKQSPDPAIVYHPCCSTVYSFIVPRQIDVEGVRYNVSSPFEQYQVVYIGQCGFPGASCYQGGVCFPEVNYPVYLLVDNPDPRGPPYIFKPGYFPRYCKCSQ